MPHHLLWPCVVIENVFAIEGVERHVLHFAAIEDGVPAVKQNLILQVDYWQMVSVSLADDAVEILELGRQEGAECSFHPDGLSLREAQEICAPDAPHGTGLRAVHGNQVEPCT